MKHFVMEQEHIGAKHLKKKLIMRDLVQENWQN